MTITFGPLSGASTHTGGAARLRIRQRGATVPGTRGRAVLQVRASGSTLLSLAPAVPAVLVSGLAPLQVRGAGGVAYQQSVGAATTLRLASLGFGGVGGRARLRVRARGYAGANGAAHAMLIPQPPEISAFGGLWFETPRETVAFASATASLPILVVRALLALHDAPAPHADVKLVLLEQLKLRDRLYAALLNLMEDGLVVGDAGTYTHQMVERAVSRLLLTGVVTGAADAYATVAAALVLGEAIDAFLLADAHDEVAFNAALTDAALYLQGVLDQVELAATVNPVHTGMALVSDAMVFDDAAITEAQLIALLHDALALSVSVSLDNGQYTAWTLNTDSGGVTTYDNYPFNSFAKIGGRYYGATSTGVYELAGDTDDGAPIAARLRLGMSEMGTRRLKAYSEVYVGYTGDGQLLLRVIFTDDAAGTKRAAEYRMKPRPAAGRRESRFEPGRGLQAVYFDFELENLDGADFDLSSVEFQPLVSNRRTRG